MIDEKLLMCKWHVRMNHSSFQKLKILSKQGEFQEIRENGPNFFSSMHLQ